MRRSSYGRKKHRKVFDSKSLRGSSDANLFNNLKRVPAELILDQGVGRAKTIFPAMLVLNELTPEGIHVFSENPFGAQQQLQVSIPSLNNLFIKGQVVGCKEIAYNAGILTQHTFRFRVELTFMFNSDSEREAVKQFCENLKNQPFSAAA